MQPLRQSILDMEAIMSVADIYEKRATFSFEVFPPKTDVGMEKLCGEGGVLEKLYTLNPDYISCTYGAGGTNVGKNLEELDKIKKDGKCTPVTHFTCIGNTKADIREKLQTYLDHGIDHMLALRGDLPFGWTGTNGDLHYATELVKFVRKEFGDKFTIAVAGSPEGHIQCRSLEADIAFLKQKQDNGADFIISQLCWDMDAFRRWLDAIRAAGVWLPVDVGIMPILDQAATINMALSRNGCVMDRALCEIISKDGLTKVMAEVVGFRENKVLLMPYDSVDGIGLGATVRNTEGVLQVPVGEELLGKVLDGIGRPMDGSTLTTTETYPIDAPPPDPLKRKLIDEVLPLGVKAVDGLLTIGKGQRIGIFAGSGVGKSTLLGMFARNTKADINVIALIGERGREVGEFIERDLGAEGLKRSVLVIATSDKPALIRNKAAKTATAIAEYFRDQGKDVLLMMDSLTRFSMAQREIGLASGEPPVTRGYPPSVYAELPKVLERAGNTHQGSITGLYTVLVDGDDFNEPITDTARGILDGHIVLSRNLAHKNHYPAIDIMASISRCMSAIASKEHKQAAGRLKNVLATYNDAEDLINIGAYKSGSNPEIDYAITKINQVNAYLMQDVDSKFLLEDELQQLYAIFE